MRAIVIVAMVVMGPMALGGVAKGDSLWRDGRHGFLFTDSKASRVGDLVTVLVTESSSTDRKAETNTKKDSSNAFTLKEFFPGVLDKIKPSVDPRGTWLDYAGRSEHKGGGAITRQDAVVAQIPATVVKVLDSGALLIEGRRAVVINDETQTLAFSGVVRAEDISPDNTVRSTQIADAEITVLGKGILEEKQRPGILQRLFDIFRIF